MTTRLLSKRLALLSLSVLSLSSAAEAQSYCAPASIVGGSHFFAFNFGSPGNNNVASPQTFSNTGSNYTNNTGVGSAGTFQRFFSTWIGYAVYNPSGSITYPSANVRAYVDWNSDGDFSDAYENPYVQPFNLPPYTSHNEFAKIAVPLNVPAGNYRLRYTYGEAGPASACGAFTGETEDFTISVDANAAPVFTPGPTPFLNNLLTSQTSTNGVSLDAFIKDAVGASLIADANDQGPNNRVSRGIAVTGQSAANGDWQYKIGAGAWTSFGSVSTTNALLISGDGLTVNDATAPVRIRFLPTGPGTPSFTYKAWDLTAGTTGSYADASVSGGTSAFSTAQQTASLNVLAAQGASLLNVYTIGGDTFMRANGYQPGTGLLVHPEKLAANSPQHVGNDIRMTDDGTMLYWMTENSIYSAAPDGTGLASVVSGTDFNTSIGLSPTHLYYSGYDPNNYLPVLYRAATNGTGAVSLIDGPGQLARADVAFFDKMGYANNRLYIWMYSLAYLPYLVSMDTDGTGVDTLYHNANAYPYGMHIVSDTAYWIENEGTDTRVMSLALTGTASPDTLATTAIYLSTLVADPANRRVLATANNRMYTVDMDAGTVTHALNLDASPNAIIANITSTPTVNGPLPIGIASWSATAAGSRAQLQWTVSAEPVGVRYEVERSADGSTFRPIGQTPGTGASRYTFYDEAPLAGTNYYRLATIAPDGSRALSAVRSLTFGAPAAIRLFPNPAGADGFTIQVPASATFPQAYTIADAAGRVLASGTLAAPVTRISGAGLAPGQYILRVMEQSFMLIRK